MLTNKNPITNFNHIRLTNTPWFDYICKSLTNRKYYTTTHGIQFRMNHICLIKVQKILQSKIDRLTKLIYKLSQIYYDPILKGGCIHKQEMLYFLDKI